MHMSGHDKMKKAAPKGQGVKGQLPPSGRMKYATGGLTSEMGEYDSVPSARNKDYDGSSEKLEQFADGGYADGGKAKKPAIMAIVAKLAKKPMTGEMPHEMGESEEKESMEESRVADEGHMVAVEEMMSALKSGDKAGFASSLKNFIKMCSYGEEE